MSVVVAVADDPEVAAITEHIRPGQLLRLDLPGIAETFTWQLHKNATTMLFAGTAAVPADEISGVLYRPRLRKAGDGTRRFMTVGENPRVESQFRHFTQTETTETLLGALLTTPVRWVNHPSAMLAAEHKLHQLTLAAQIGLEVPPTIVSADAERLIEFWHEHHGEVITKAVQPLPVRTLGMPLSTQRVRAAQLDVLRAAPPSTTLFQRLVPAALDLRATVVGDEIFTAAVHSQEGASPLDSRLDRTVPMSMFELDDATAEALRRLTARLGLQYAAADFRLRPDGTPVFLEVNARGAFLFLEQRVDLPISAAIADLITRG